MLNGELPFDDHSKRVLYKKICMCEYDMPFHFSEEAKDLIRQIFVRDPSKRISIAEIKNHRWFKMYGFGKKLAEFEYFQGKKKVVDFGICKDVVELFGDSKEGEN